MESRLLSREEGRATLRYPVLEKFTNPRDVLRGCVYGVMMDTAMAVGSTGVSTVTMQTTIFRPASAGFLLVTAGIIRQGRRIVYAEAEIHDEKGMLVAKGNQPAIPIGVDVESNPQK